MPISSATDDHFLKIHPQHESPCGQLETCKGFTLMPRTGSSASGRQDLGRATSPVGCRELCQAKTEANGKPVTESNPGRPAPAQRLAVMPGRHCLLTNQVWDTDQGTMCNGAGRVTGRSSSSLGGLIAVFVVAGGHDPAAGISRVVIR